MSKSLGNFFTVHELLDQYPGEAIRLLLLSAHYRQPLDFTPEGLAAAKATLDRWYGLLRGKAVTPAASVPKSVEDALLDDINTPLAISAPAPAHRSGGIAGRRPGARPPAAGGRGVVPLDAGGFLRTDRCGDRDRDRRPASLRARRRTSRSPIASARISKPRA